MQRLIVYLDTSVISAYFDERAPDRCNLTRRFWAERLPEFSPLISDLVLAEIRETRDEQRRKEMLRLAEPMAVAPRTEDAAKLAAEYVRRGVVSPADFNDALHLALATTNGIGFLLSWNFRHMVKLSTRREVNLLNSLLHYGPLEILAPPEL